MKKKLEKRLDKIEIIEAVQGRAYKTEENPLVSGVTTDSRTISTGDLYVAIPGERVDGHDFIESALVKGAVLAFSQKKIELFEEKYRHRIVEVDNTIKALADLSRTYLAKFATRKVAVTGSSGKTTTKDMIYYVLNHNFHAQRSEGNHNNEIGLPLTVMNLADETEVAVFEMGMYDLGEIHHLADIVKPEIAVITNIGSCHIERLGSRDNIFKAKMEITDYMTPRHTLVVNGDNDYLGSLRQEEYPFEIIKCGLTKENHLRAYDITCAAGRSYFRLSYSKGELPQYKGEQIQLPAVGDHNIQNALCAIGCGLVLGMTIPQIAQGLLEFRTSELRMEITEKNGVTIINDSYNANPESMMAVLESIRNYGEGRRIAVLGDMLELGDISKVCHQQIGVKVAKDFQLAVFIGQEMKQAVVGAQNAGMNTKSIFHFMNRKEATSKIKQLLISGDIVLLKGSRGMKLDEVADSLIERLLQEDVF